MWQVCVKLHVSSTPSASGVPVALAEVRAQPRAARGGKGMNKVAGLSWVSALVLLAIVVIALLVYNR